jgi:hypothetical protein
MQNEGGGGIEEDIVMNSYGSSGPSDEPRMDKLCTLLLPPLRQQLGGTGSHARISRVFGIGELFGHQRFSSGRWPEYYRAPPCRGIFRQLKRDIVCLGGSCNVELVVRCNTLLAYADGALVVPTANCHCRCQCRLTTWRRRWTVSVGTGTGRGR